MSARIIAIANWKGGSGKTSTAVNLSANLAILGKKSLLIDLDPQSHSTISLGILPYNLQNTIFEFFLYNSNDFDKFIRHTDVNGLDIIPATKRLINLETEVFNFANKEIILKEKISGIKDNYDFVVFDCPPSLGLLTMNALISSTEILIPLQTHFLALEGLSQIVEAVNRINKAYNGSLKLTGIIPTMTNLQTRLSKEVLSEIKNYFGENMILTPIRNDIKIAEAPSHRKPLCIYSPKSRGNQDYTALALQVLNLGVN
jgi:chromosome partitioning protein